MGYKHFGAIGDILKHLMLCQFLKQEKPLVYCESNSAAALYELDKGFNRQYGIHHFYEGAMKLPELRDSEYIKSLQKVNGKGLSHYLGSPGLSMIVLGNSCQEYFFCDIDEESLININRFAAKHSITSKVILNKGDGMDGVEQFLNKMGKDIYSNIFVHLDPYNPFENSIGQKTAVQLFPELVNKGMKVMLWFGIETVQNRKSAKRLFYKMQSETRMPIYTAETILNIISDSMAPINPGILGCGIIAGNLSANSIECLKKYGASVESIYEHSLIDGKYDGGLKFIFNELLKEET